MPALLLFQLLRFPISQLPNQFSAFLSAQVCLRRGSQGAVPQVAWQPGVLLGVLLQHVAACCIKGAFTDLLTHFLTFLVGSSQLLIPLCSAVSEASRSLPSCWGADRTARRLLVASGTGPRARGGWL